jgi:hypothetical protein
MLRRLQFLLGLSSQVPRLQSVVIVQQAIIFLNIPFIQNYIDKEGSYGFTKVKTNTVYS